MSFISKIDTKFVNFVSRKYNKTFKFFDEYIVWLYEKKTIKEDYYNQLEKDLWEYSDFQTGSPRDKEAKKR